MDPSESPENRRELSREELGRMLRQLYQDCDELRTGAVDASKLVRTIRAMIVDPTGAISKWSLQDLNRMLDPNLDDQKVGEKEFVRAGLDWVAKVKLAEQRQKERILLAEKDGGEEGGQQQVGGLVPSRLGRWSRRHARSQSMGGEGGGGFPNNEDETANSSFGILVRVDRAKRGLQYNVTAHKVLLLFFLEHFKSS